MFKKHLALIILSLSFSFLMNLNAQIAPGVYMSERENENHELKISENYIIHSVYSSDPAEFVKTHGGFYTLSNGELKVSLEFNSNFEKDGKNELVIPFTMDNNTLTLQTEMPLVFTPMDKSEQDLDGQWLFATRGPDEGQERRGEENTRKTLKFLKDGRFQWIAYDTEGMQFKGTGGGSYTSEDGIYTENIEYFSRDNSRVGASLNFDYEIKDDDWHHTGNNSKGEPLYEIWARRE